MGGHAGRRECRHRPRPGRGCRPLGLCSRWRWRWSSCWCPPWASSRGTAMRRRWSARAQGRLGSQVVATHVEWLTAASLLLMDETDHVIGDDVHDAAARRQGGAGAAPEAHAARRELLARGYGWPGWSPPKVARGTALGENVGLTMAQISGERLWYVSAMMQAADKRRAGLPHRPAHRAERQAGRRRRHQDPGRGDVVCVALARPRPGLDRRAAARGRLAGGTPPAGGQAREPQRLYSVH